MRSVKMVLDFIHLVKRVCVRQLERNKKKKKYIRPKSFKSIDKARYDTVIKLNKSSKINFKMC